MNTNQMNSKTNTVYLGFINEEIDSIYGRIETIRNYLYDMEKEGKSITEIELRTSMLEDCLENLQEELK